MAKPAILTVDDDADVLSSVTRDLKSRYGREYRVLPTDSGEAALELLGQLAERDTPVALILSDQRMPGMDGVALLSRAAEQCPRAKRVLLTAYADTEEAVRAINQSRVDYYLLKPWDPPEEKLFSVLDDMLEDWRSGYRPGYGGVRVVGDRWSARCHTIRDFLARNQVPYSFLDVEVSDEARSLAEGLAPDQLPLVILADGQRLHAPDPQAVAARIGLEAQAKQDFYDLAIVGAGPGGLAAAVYGGSEGLRTVLIEREAPGGHEQPDRELPRVSGGSVGRGSRAQGRRAGP